MSEYLGFLRVVSERTDEDEEPDPDYDSSYHTISLPDSVNQSSNLIVDEQNAKNKFQHGEIRNKRSTKRNRSVLHLITSSDYYCLFQCFQTI